VTKTMLVMTRICMLHLRHYKDILHRKLTVLKSFRFKFNRVRTSNTKPFICMAYCSKKMFAGGRDSLVPVPKCPRDTSAVVLNCPDISPPVWWCRNVLGP